MKKIVGIPSDGPDLSDNISNHFGHCRYFVGVEIADSEFDKAFALPNDGHSSCMEPVLNMKKNNVTDMIVGGIGGRPYMGFIQEGINLFQGIQASIKENINLLLEGKLKKLGSPSCSGNPQGPRHS
ncbi:MAG: putative dinitrogenase iron-molybdenum cofactor biosynthesis protein [Promethearchaeota archaeon]|nr:MAG: putative dinitrogenase iron-molybdenum cofactor biosynthesis protein [Candidatus Lokiarchaeota archaeon]